MKGTLRAIHALSELMHNLRRSYKYFRKFNSIHSLCFSSPMHSREFKWRRDLKH